MDLFYFQFLLHLVLLLLSFVESWFQPILFESSWYSGWPHVGILFCSAKGFIFCQDDELSRRLRWCQGGWWRSPYHPRWCQGQRRRGMITFINYKYSIFLRMPQVLNVTDSLPWNASLFSSRTSHYPLWMYSSGHDLNRPTLSFPVSSDSYVLGLLKAENWPNLRKVRGSLLQNPSGKFPGINIYHAVGWWLTNPCNYR